MRSLWRWLGLIGLLAVFFAQAVGASPHTAVTFDEQYHLTPGYVYLKLGDFRFHHDQNPPFFEALVSLPLLFRPDIALPTDHPAFRLWGDVYLFSDAFLWQANADAHSMVHAGRVVVAVFGVLLGLLLFWWGRQWYGEKAGWLAVFLFAFDPNFIAHAIPTLDLGLAFFVTLAVWRVWRYLHYPTRLNILLAGLALGAALATKFISVILLPSFALILLIYPNLAKASQPSPGSLLIRRALAGLAMIAVAWLVVWAVYRFQFGPVSGAGLPVPAPLYFESFIGMFLKSSEGRSIFLDGQVSPTGWPQYFAIALLLKTPIPVLLFALVALLRWPYRREWRASSILIVPAVLFFVGASMSRLQLGYRYLLPVLPFLFLIAARGVTFAWPRRMIAPLVALSIWLVAGTLSIFPHYLSYFNEIAGGPANGYNHLVDSNLDWGQDLPALKDWIDRRRPDDLRLAFFGSAYPDRYGVHATGLPGYPLSAYGREADGFTSYSLEPGVYAISATSLRLGLVARQLNLYQAFASMTPIDRVAYSILVYDVRYPPGADIDRAVIAGPLASDAPPDALGKRPGHQLRAKWCAWPECFVFTPHPARYVVRDFIPFAPDLAEQARTRAQPIESPASSGTPVYWLDATSIVEEKLAALAALPLGAPDQTPLAFPVPFDNGLSLAGYEARADRAAPGGTLDVITYWRVSGRITPPMTVFVHLLDARGNIGAQHDGFGAALTTLEPGDIVIQQHPIALADTPPGVYRLQVGLYDPVKLDRFAARPPGVQPMDRVVLSSVEIREP